MKLADSRLSIRSPVPLRRLLWPVLFFMLLLPFLSGCTRTIYARPAHAVTPSLTLTATQVPAESTPSGPSLRSLFLGATTDSDTASSLYKFLSKTALRSPLASPVSALDAQIASDAYDILPTLTPTPAETIPFSIEESTSVSTTAAVTELLDLSVAEVTVLEVTSTPGPDSAQSNESPVLLPTPTPSIPTPIPSQPPAAAPTPDGIPRTARVPILMYHYISVPPADADIYRQDLSVSPELFASHLDAMQTAGYTPVTLYDLVAHLTHGAPLPEKPVILTFDDGYRDNHKYALPRLRERDVVATFFVVTDFIDDERPEYLTWDMAREMVDAGMKIESHGRNHVSLRDKDNNYLIWQALGSMETIEYELGTRPRFVSYPAGEYDKTTADIFTSAGYWAGATTVQGATHSSDSLFDLNRVRVRGTTTPAELLRLLALDW